VNSLLAVDAKDPTLKACKGSAASLKIFNSYTLYRQQDKEGKLDFNSSKLQKSYSKDAVRSFFIHLFLVKLIYLFSLRFSAS
jgi:hypothetical protein